MRKIIFSLFLTLMMAVTASATEVNIYSHRQEFLLKPVLDAFTAETGITANVIYAPKGGLIQRLKAEGKNSPADVVMTADISDMMQYENFGLLAPHNSTLIMENIPAKLRNDDAGWFALTKRARVLALSADRLPQDLSLDLEDLAAPEWQGRICTRAGSHPYNRALMASLIHAHGEAATQEWGRGLVQNLARKPQGNDRAQAKAISEGLCDIAVMNSYYYGKMKENPEQQNWADSVRISFTNQGNRGNHINVSTAALSFSSKNRKQAVRLLEFLTTPEAQSIYAEVNYEYPANPKVKPSKTVASWGTFKEDDVDIRVIAEKSPVAQRVIDRIQW